MKSAPTYILRSRQNPKLVLCKGGAWRPESLVGPGGYAAKVYRTRTGAESRAAVRGDLVVEVAP